ncbi:MAG: hypothetical protein ABIT01_13350 [Thermoanaerobaculia bacterium]
MTGAGIVAFLLVGLPLTGTIWTRSANLIKIPRGVKLPFPNATYSTRDWNLAISSVEVREDSSKGDSVAPKWLFYYKNTDHENHYVLITVQCQDVSRKDRARFSYTATLLADQKDETPIEILSKTKTDDWKNASFARITIDFLSTPNG